MLKKSNLANALVAVALGLTISLPAHAAGFDGTLFGKASQNAQSKEGQAYDQKLTEAFKRQPKFLEGVQACLKAHPGKHQVVGYFLIHPDRPYEVHLLQKTPLADCLTKAMTGFRVPKPDTLPWVNLFNLDTTPKAERDKEDEKRKAK